ncbi:hypothetical protein A2U01_0111056, partial [Trifolium medium]|nr:hypothetical protein [Trifolium medium]
AEEEELRIEEDEEEKRKQEEKQKLPTEKDTSDVMVIETSECIDKGKVVASEHDPLVLRLQEQLATQKAE